MTEKVYLVDPFCRAFDADVAASRDGWCTLSRTAFYPGGGGQPPDRGRLVVGAETLQVDEAREDDAGDVWHRVSRDLDPGTHVHGELDWAWRHALMRAHALMHVVNTVARDRFGGIITGVQLGPQRSRIDFKLGAFAREHIPELERLVNEVLSRGLPVTATTISEDEFRRRPELVRTLGVKPPIIDGRVRVVEIEGFDAQACGGTHVHSTAEVGRARVVKFDNKGKDNKRSTGSSWRRMTALLPSVALGSEGHRRARPRSQHRAGELGWRSATVLTGQLGCSAAIASPATRQPRPCRRAARARPKIRRLVISRAANLMVYTVSAACAEAPRGDAP